MSHSIHGARVLLIEDNEGDYILTKELLAQRPDLEFQLEWVASADEGLAALIENRHEICLTDYRLGTANGLEIVRRARERGSEVPVIVLTGEHNQSVDAEAIEAGACDYLVKRQLSGDQLTRSIRYALVQRSVEDKLRALARTDQLTGLANRGEFMSELDFALRRSGRGAKAFAILYLDLDGFKQVNDTLGHAQGDLLLQEVANRLTTCLRSVDLVARIGGDEFTILALDVESSRDCATIAQKVLAKLSEPFRLGGHEVLVSASIGISMFPDGGRDADELTRNADTAMYRAKKEGGHRFQFHSNEITSAARDRIDIESELRKAIAAGELDLVYQPQVCIGSGQITGFEALARWCHHRLGDVPPTAFIQVAEDIGCIRELGAWVLRRSAMDYKHWERLGLSGPSLSVNISAHQLNDPHFPESARAILEEAKFDPSKLVLELTETAIIGDLGVARSNICRFHSFGARVCVDDFGIGYSGLSQLRDLPLDVLKIDKSFVHNLLNRPKEKAITHAIIDLAKRFELEVIAEGVESEDQARTLTALGCGLAQGYHYYRPLPSAAIGELCAKAAATNSDSVRQSANVA